MSDDLFDSLTKIGRSWFSLFEADQIIESYEEVVKSFYKVGLLYVQQWQTRNFKISECCRFVQTLDKKFISILTQSTSYSSPTLVHNLSVCLVTYLSFEEYHVNLWKQLFESLRLLQSHNENLSDSEQFDVTQTVLNFEIYFQVLLNLAPEAIIWALSAMAEKYENFYQHVFVHIHKWPEDDEKIHKIYSKVILALMLNYI